MHIEKKWILREGSDNATVRRLSSELGVDPVLAELLVQRGVYTFEQARSFFRPALADLHDPFLMTDMEQAVTRVHTAVTGREKILVYGDYDVDGITSITVLKSFLEDRGLHVDSYIPNRLEEGYGLNKPAIEKIAQENYTLMITVDCGISGIEEVDYANSLGIETEPIREDTFTGKKMTFFHDPDGLPLEIHE